MAEKTINLIFFLKPTYGYSMEKVKVLVFLFSYFFFSGERKKKLRQYFYSEAL